MRTTSSRGGFTLIELLAVVAVIGVLVALMLPAVQQSREAARRSRCQNNLKQVALALHAYHDRSGSFPPTTVVDRHDLGWWSWIARILPELEERTLYEQLDLREDAWENCRKYKPITSQRLPALVCPSDPHGGRIFQSDVECPGGQAYALTNYLGCRGSTRPQPDAEGFFPPQFTGNGAFPGVNRTAGLAQVLDGASQTILVGERPVDPTLYLGWWATGMGLDDLGLGDYILDTYEGLYASQLAEFDDLLHYGSAHPGGANVAMCDGSVHFLAYSIEMPTFVALGSRNGGEIVSGL